MIPFKTFIAELFIHGATSPSTSKVTNIITTNKDVFLINQTITLENLLYILDKLNIKELKDDFIKQFNIDATKVNKKISINYIDYIMNYMVNIDKRDYVVGYINDEDKNLYLYTKVYMSDPKSSIVINKLIKQLKLNKTHIVKYKQNDIIYTYDNTDIKGEIPDIAYHGTSTVYLRSILDKGLKSNISPTNYSFIKNKDVVFFTTTLIKSLFYSTVTSIKRNGIPVIFEFEIPNKDLIIADYDVEMLSNTQKYYTKSKKHPSNVISYRVQHDPLKLSKEFGLYGYKGSISPIKIKKVYIYKYDDTHFILNYAKINIRDFDAFSLSEAKNLLKTKSLNVKTGLKRKQSR